MPASPTSIEARAGSGRRPSMPGLRAGLLRVVDRPLTYRLLPPLLFAVVWQVYAESDAGGFVIPSFTETMQALGELVRDGAFWSALLESNQALVLGFVAAVVAGIPLGLAMGRFPLLQRAADPYMSILVVMPIAALIPILVMSVGIGLTARVILVALFAFPMVVVNTYTGVRQVDPKLIEMARSFMANERQIWRRILIPGAMPAIMTGVRIGLGRAITGMVIAELLMVSVGIGELILEFRSMFSSDALYATVIIVVAEAIVLMAVARRIERRLMPWTRDGGIDGQLA